MAKFEKRFSHAGLYQVAQILSETSHTRQALADFVGRLASVADHAYLNREFDIVGDVGRLMLNLPLGRQLQAAGHYYRALSLNHSTLDDTARAGSLFEQVADTGSSQYRARAMLALGGNSFTRGDYVTAMSFYREVVGIITRDHVLDPTTLYFVSRMTTVVKALRGDRRGALADLERMFPIARMAGSLRPCLYYDYLNSLAVELSEAQRLDEAKNVSQIALASPFAPAYPEWRETRNEIDLRGRRPSHATVAFSQRISEAAKLRPIRWERVAVDTAVSHPVPNPQNIIRLPAPERSDSLGGSPPASGPAHVLSMQEWKEKMRKRSVDDPHKGRPATEKERRARLKETRNLDTRELLMRIMDLVGDESVTDDLLIKAVIVLEGLDPDENQRA